MATEYAKKVAEGLIGQLKAGTAPWQKPWQPGEQFMPYNPTTGKEYRGGNTLWLMAQGHSDPRWMTYRQASAEGAQVRRGEHGTQIQYWITKGTEPVTDAEGRPVRGDDGKPLTRTVNYERPRVKTFTVFNAEQIDGLPPAPTRTISEWERHERAEAILSGSGVSITHQAGDRAYYQPSTDKIVLPERGQFPSGDRYYATALHELGHASGHPSRLARDLAHPFGSQGYAREELRAEIASLITGTEIGVGHDPSRHAAYVGSWIKALENEPQEIFRAAADAEKIAGMLRGFDRTREQGNDIAEEVKAEEARERQADGTFISQQSAESGTVLVRVPTLVREKHPVMNTSSERVYLAVPYAEKDQAKAAGAKWDREAKAWFAPAGADLAGLSAWLPPRDELHVAPTLDPRAEFADALRTAGLEINGLPEMDGQLHRVRVVGDTGRQLSGAYVGHLDGHPAGFIENFKEGLRTNWKSGTPIVALDAQDRARLAAEAAQKRHDRAIGREQAAQAAALTAETAWSAAQPAAVDHPYLAAKGIAPGELRTGAPGQMVETTDKEGRPRTVSLEGRLLVPMRDIDGKLWSYQTIDADGTKSFNKGGRVEGCHAVLGELKADSPVIIAEGYATAATIHQATGLPVIAAFNAGNIAPVAQVYRDRHPERTVIIAGDNDHQKEADRNVGRRKAEEAAVSVGGYTLLPDFAADDRGTDWNDYQRTNGVEATTQAIMTGVRAIQAQSIAAELHREEEQAEEHAHELQEERQGQAYEDEQVELQLVEREQEHEQSLGMER
jgi:putative DNA primase/helicase